MFPPELQAESKRRDYLYGRLFAVADFMEEKSTDKGRDYPTNAIRLMCQFVKRPFETWPKIHEKLVPCFKSLGADSKRYQILFAKIEGQFTEEDKMCIRDRSIIKNIS